MASQMISYLPPAEGLLPKWLLFVRRSSYAYPYLIINGIQISIVSMGNSIQSYISMKGTREVYAGSATSANSKAGKEQSSPVTPLSARTFGTWTAITSIVRLYSAYNIRDPVIYQMCMWTFVIAFMHFISEWLVFGTARWGRGLAGPVFVATGTLTWMLMQWEAYVV